jgi:hypothetical protein
MTIWAIKNPDEQEHIDFVASSLRQGMSRFGWSYANNCNLAQLDNMSWDEMNDDQAECYRKANFLLQVEPGDWIVHINVPSYGQCISAQVVGAYSFDSTPNPVNDFRHTLQIDPATLVGFDRNDPNVLPAISNRLKLPGRYWRIGHLDDFQQTLTNLASGAVVLAPEQRAETYHLRQEMQPILADITAKVQKNNPKGKLEEFMAEVLRQVPGVTAVEENGKYKGWGTDNGADLIVHYEAGIPSLGVLRPAKLVVQVKSYTATHESTEAIDQIEEALRHFQAETALIISTGQPSEGFRQAFEAATTRLADEGKLVSLISGNDVARLVLKFGIKDIL